MTRLLILLFGLTCTTAWAADSPVGLERIEVQPSEVKLAGPRSSVQVIVTGHFAGGVVRDLTHESEYRVAGPAKAERGFVTPTGDGSGSITVVCSDKSQILPVAVERFNEPAPVSFHLETLAVLTKQGCNSGSCHGKPNGRGALELSLNAFDPQADERTLIRGPLLRFTHPLDPDESLLLKKPLLRLPHGGGKRLQADDHTFAVLRQWIAEGCRPDPKDAPQAVKVEVTPSVSRALKLEATGDSAPQAQQQVRVVAHYSDGSQRDVTQIATFTVSNDAVASVDSHGLVTGHERGQTAVVVRYLDDIVSTYITFVRDVPGFAWNNPAESNFVDNLVNRKLRQLQYLPSDVCDDGTFLRRVSLDVRGLLPSIAETTAFLADKSPHKRTKLVERLTDSPEYARYWGLRLADLLRINTKTLSAERSTAYARWVVESVAKNQPYDQFVSELLTSHGNTAESPPANFFRTTTDTKMVTETVAQLFLGSRVMCAQCHNHPYESWTQNNYYQIGAAFHEIDRNLLKAEELPKGKRKIPDARDADMVIARSPGRTMSNPRTGAAQKPWPTDVVRGKGEDYRMEFARWLTARGNPYFARVAVNRIWAQLFGRGLVEPIDDFRSSNPAINVELLDALAKSFEESGFDRKHVIRLILNSQTYQRRSETVPLNETDELLNSHARTRLLAAEQMQDAIVRVCDGAEQFEQIQRELDVAEKRLQGLLSDPLDKPDPKPIEEATKRCEQARSRVNEYFMTQQAYPHLTTFLTAFGQPPRETACACERREEANLDQALQLMNSSMIRDRVGHARARYEKMTNEEIVRELYLAALSRNPRDVERAKLLAHLEKSPDRRQAIEDVVWAVLNTNEFMFQH